MTLYLINRVDQRADPLTFNASEPFEKSIGYLRFEAACRSFFANSKEKELQLEKECSPLLSTENRPLLKTLYVQPFNHISRELIETIYRIATFIRSRQELPFVFARYKIQNLCSVTLFDDHETQDSFYFHAKKKHFDALKSFGRDSKFFCSLRYSHGILDQVGEKTLTREPLSAPSAGLLELSERLFLVKNFALYTYTCKVHVSASQYLFREKKAELMPYYDISLCEFLQIHQNEKFLTEVNLLKIAFFLALCVKELHEKNLVHRDLKPENILVKFTSKDGTYSLNHFELIACDLETVILEEKVRDSWIGTKEYWPKKPHQEKQIKPADIYALGTIYRHLFNSWPSSPLGIINLIRLTYQMKSENPEERPTIARVIELLEASKPPSQSERDPSCIGSLDCTIV